MTGNSIFSPRKGKSDTRSVETTCPRSHGETVAVANSTHESCPRALCFNHGILFQYGTGIALHRLPGKELTQPPHPLPSPRLRASQGKKGEAKLCPGWVTGELLSGSAGSLGRVVAHPQKSFLGPSCGPAQAPFTLSRVHTGQEDPAQTPRGAASSTTGCLPCAAMNLFFSWYPCGEKEKKGR